MAGHRRRRHTLLLAPTGSGKTLAAFLSALDGFVRDPDQRGTRVLYVSPLKALNHDIERNLRAPVAGIAFPRSPHDRCAAKRRHQPARAGGHPPPAARHPDHHARVAVPDADLGRPRRAGDGRDGDRRRDPRGGRHQAGGAPGAVAGAAGPAGRRRPAAGWAVGDPAAAGGGGPVPGRRPPGHHRRCRVGQAARPGGGGAGRRHARAGRGAGGRGRAAAVDLAGRLPAAAGAGAGAPLDDRVRQ